MKRNQLFAVLGVLVSVVFLFFAFRELDPDAFWRGLRDANLPLLALAMGVYLLAMLIITWRWRFLLRSFADASVLQLYPLVAIGYMGNNIYPFRSGEVLRIFLLRRNHNVPYARGATTVVVERVFDGIVMLTFVLVPLAFLNIASVQIQRIALVASVIFGTALAVFLFLAARPQLLRQLAHLFARLLPATLAHKMLDVADEIVNGLQGLRSPSDLFGTFFASYATWMVEAGVYWLVAIAFNLGVGYPVLLLTVGVVNLAGLIPAAPGMAGVFELSVRLVLTTVGVSAALATAYAVVVHGVIWLPPTLTGAFFLARQGLNLVALTRAQELQETSLSA